MGVFLFQARGAAKLGRSHERTIQIGVLRSLSVVSACDQPSFFGVASPENVASAPAKPEAAAAPVDPAGIAGIDEEVDYWAAQKVGSLDGWRSFLAAHGSGVYAQAARAEMQKLLSAEKASAPAKPEAAAAPVDPAGTAGNDEELLFASFL